jgi:single-strand DNA-binding protein
MDFSPFSGCLPSGVDTRKLLGNLIFARTENFSRFISNYRSAGHRRCYVGRQFASLPMRRKQMSLNKILLIGNLGSDPEVRFTAAKKQITQFRIATNRRYRIEGELHEEVEWFSIVTFGRLAEISAEYLKKGKSVFIEGRMRTRTWLDPSGVKHYRTEVIAEGLTMIGNGKRNGDASQVTAMAAAPVEDSEPF